jgi:hypothetical protein
MTVPCLEEMLLSCLFRPRMETLALLPQHAIDGRKVGRVGLEPTQISNCSPS